jgi:hypothetical protein
MLSYTKLPGFCPSTYTSYNFSETVGLIDFIFFKKLLWNVPFQFDSDDDN